MAISDATNFLCSAPPTRLSVTITAPSLAVSLLSLIAVLLAYLIARSLF